MIVLARLFFVKKMFNPMSDYQLKLEIAKERLETLKVECRKAEKEVRSAFLESPWFEANLTTRRFIACDTWIRAQQDVLDAANEVSNCERAMETENE